MGFLRLPFPLDSHLIQGDRNQVGWDTPHLPGPQFGKELQHPTKSHSSCRALIPLLRFPLPSQRPKVAQYFQSPGVSPLPVGFFNSGQMYHLLPARVATKAVPIFLETVARGLPLENPEEGN